MNTNDINGSLDGLPPDSEDETIVLVLEEDSSDRASDAFMAILLAAILAPVMTHLIDHMFNPEELDEQIKNN